MEARSGAARLVLTEAAAALMRMLMRMLMHLPPEQQVGKAKVCKAVQCKAHSAQGVLVLRVRGVLAASCLLAHLGRRRESASPFWAR